MRWTSSPKNYGGDPASALLEVLDPEQNGSFTDHYMNVPYDLSNVLFVCTANSTDTIPEPLLNRMEVIQFPGYTAVEKFQIARRHLLPKAMKSMGIKAQNLKVTDEAIRRIIERVYSGGWCPRTEEADGCVMQICSCEAGKG